MYTQMHSHYHSLRIFPHSLCFFSVTLHVSRQVCSARITPPTNKTTVNIWSLVMHSGEVIFKCRLWIVWFSTVRTNYRMSMVTDRKQVLTERVSGEFSITHITLYIICKEKQKPRFKYTKTMLNRKLQLSYWNFENNWNLINCV